MSNRTSICKKRLAELLAIEAIHKEFCDNLQTLADAEKVGGTVKNFVSRSNNIELSVNTINNTIKDYS